MSWPPTNPTRPGILGPNSARFIRPAVAMLLRVGIGLSMLGTGLAGYFNAQRSGANLNPWGQNLSMVGLNPFLALLPYLSIILGVALILGFLTTFTAIAAGFYSLLGPTLLIIQIVSQGPMNGINGMGMAINPYFEMMMMTGMSQLLVNAALIWFSPLENHPYSVDALIFGRNQVEPNPSVPDLRNGPLIEADSVSDHAES